MIESLQKISKQIEGCQKLSALVKVSENELVRSGTDVYSLYKFSIGTSDPKAAVLFVVGGVHGIERIGAQLAWSFLKTTIDRLVWDESLLQILDRVRIVVIPLLNPVGYFGFKRSNGNEVDLMRNAPIDAIDQVPFLLGGHRFSSKLPWYRGAVGDFQHENQFLEKSFVESCGQSNIVISLDLHSGFGMRDRIWFPFSFCKKPFDQISSVQSLFELFEDVYPYHIYQIEPQSKGYLLNGDIWDYLFLKHQTQNKTGVFLPFTLEMGSWNWVRKNPLQLFTREGVFNPVKEHRLKRTFRRHHLFLDFLLRALYSNEAWLPQDQKKIEQCHQEALRKWYN